MIALGLNAADLKLFTASLSTHHSMKVTLQVLTLNHAYVGDLTPRLLDGQVNIDATAEVTRSLTLQLNDPDGTLQLDSTNPNDGALFYDRMIRVVYSIKSDLLPRWVDVPIFCGPVTKMSRTADVINVECQGKETLSMPPTFPYLSNTYAKGWNRAALVKTLMARYSGETKFSIPSLSGTTAGPIILTGETDLWKLCRSIIGAGRSIFYDGRGVLCIRALPTTSTFTYKTGPGGNVTTVPTAEYDVSEVRNIVKVKGAIPKGKKVPVTAVSSLPRTHPMNAFNLGRNGVPRYLLEVIDDDNVKTTAQAAALAKTRVTNFGLQSVDVKFDALVAPHLEPGDVFTLKTDSFAVNARYGQAVIPLRSGAGSVGYLAKKSTNKTRIRRK